MTSTLFSSEWLELSLKGLLLFTIGGVCAMSTRRSSAAVRHGVWTLTLGSVLTLPVLSVCMPSVNVPVLPAVTLRAAVSGQPPTATTAAGERSPAAVSHAGYQKYVQAASTAGTGQFPSKHAAWALQTVVLLWLCGTACFASKLLLDAWRTNRAVRRMRPLPGAGWTRLIDKLVKRAKITASIRIGLSPGLPTPITWGLRHPVILLPLGAGDWPDDRRRAVLLHELAHIRRLDHLWNLIGFLSLGVYWLNPMAWYAYRRLAIERERATDDWVVHMGVEGCDYASHLLAIVRDVPRLVPGPWLTSTMADRAGLRCRLHSLLDDRIRRDPLSTRILLTMIPVAVALLVTVAPVHLSSSHAQEKIIALPDKVEGAWGTHSTRSHEPTPGSAVSVVEAFQFPTTTRRPDTGEGPEASESTTGSASPGTSSKFWRIPPLESWLGRLGEPREGAGGLIPPLESVIKWSAASNDDTASMLPPLIWAMTALARDSGKVPVDPDSDHTDEGKTGG